VDFPYIWILCPDVASHSANYIIRECVSWERKFEMKKFWYLGTRSVLDFNNPDLFVLKISQLVSSTILYSGDRWFNTEIIKKIKCSYIGLPYYVMYRRVLWYTYVPKFWKNPVASKKKNKFDWHSFSCLRRTIILYLARNVCQNICF
jgi:hypothetical protein